MRTGGDRAQQRLGARYVVATDQHPGGAHANFDDLRRQLVGEKQDVRRVLGDKTVGAAQALGIAVERLVVVSVGPMGAAEPCAGLPRLAFPVIAILCGGQMTDTSQVEELGVAGVLGQQSFKKLIGNGRITEQKLGMRLHAAREGLIGMSRRDRPNAAEVVGLPLFIHPDPQRCLMEDQIVGRSIKRSDGHDRRRAFGILHAPVHDAAAANIAPQRLLNAFGVHPVARSRASPGVVPPAIAPR